MKQTIFLSFLAILLVSTPFSASADTYVSGYFRSDGTYVRGHWRSDADSNPYNNYSYPGNYNPYTGVTASGRPSTYLNNYYGRSNNFGHLRSDTAASLNSYNSYRSSSYGSSYVSPFSSSYNSLLR